MLQEISYLREIAETCRQGAALEPELASWLGSRLEEFLGHRVRHLHDAFGLRNGRGGVPWWMEEAIRKRKAALRLLSDKYYEDLSPSARARKICQCTERYAASAWRFDKTRAEMPETYEGTPKQYLWEAFRSGAPMPIGERQLRAIVSRGSRTLLKAPNANSQPPAQTRFSTE